MLPKATVYCEDAAAPPSTSRNWSSASAISSPSTTSRSRCRSPARFSDSWGPTARANRPPSAFCAGCWRPLRAARRWAASTSATQPEEIKQQHRLHVAEVFALRRSDRRGEHRILRRRLRRLARKAARAPRLRSENGGPGRQARHHDAAAAGGWKQRLALGCAILHEPPILFLDEPTSGVDPIARRSFWELIYQLSAAGHTIFVTTHYMDEAEYCHRIALMYGGRMIALGSPAELKTIARRGPSVESGDVGSAGQHDRAGRSTTDILDVAVFGGGLHMKVDDADAAIAEIRSALERAGHHTSRRWSPSRRRWKTCSSA